VRPENNYILRSLCKVASVSKDQFGGHQSDHHPQQCDPERQCLRQFDASAKAVSKEICLLIIFKFIFYIF